MLAAEATHRDHAVIEQVIAELKNGPVVPTYIGAVHRERRLAGLRGDRRQPHLRHPAVLTSRHHALTRTCAIRTQLIHTRRAV